MSEILSFSEKAKSRLKEIMSSENHKEYCGLRISVESGGCAGMTYKMDYIQNKIEGDENSIMGLPIQKIKDYLSRIK